MFANGSQLRPPESSSPAIALSQPAFRAHLPVCRDSHSLSPCNALALSSACSPSCSPLLSSPAALLPLFILLISLYLVLSLGNLFPRQKQISYISSVHIDWTEVKCLLFWEGWGRNTIDTGFYPWNGEILNYKLLARTWGFENEPALIIFMLLPVFWLGRGGRRWPKNAGWGLFGEFNDNIVKLFALESCGLILALSL